MFRYSPVVLILVVLTIWQSCHALKTFNKSHYVSNERNSTIDIRAKDGRIIYALCDAHQSGMRERKCRLVAEKSANKNDSYSCDLRLRTNGTIGPKFIVGGLDRHKALLVWEDKGDSKRYLRSNIVQMKDCKVLKNKISFDRDRSFRDNTILLYDDSYDVFFRNSKICGTKLCKVTLSADNKVVNGPIAYLEDPKSWHSLRRIDANSSDKGYLYVKRDANDTSIFVIQNDGSAKHLKQIPDKPKISSSTANDLISTCYVEKNNNEIKCAQYDASGKLKFEISATTDAKDETQLLYVHNLSQGGVIMVLRECDEKNCRRNACRHVIVAKYDANGKKVGSKIEEDPRGGWMTFYENEKKNYCLLKARGYVNAPVALGKQKMKIAYKCFEDTDFVQK